MTVINTLPQTQENELHRSIILQIFSSIGRCRFLDEKHFDACTALSGAGPAFACIFLEAMADGGVMMGLPRAEALELAAQSWRLSTIPQALGLHITSIALQGAARMVLQVGAHPAQIKDSVTSQCRIHASISSRLTRRSLQLLGDALSQVYSLWRMVRSGRQLLARYKSQQKEPASWVNRSDKIFSGKQVSGRLIRLPNLCSPSDRCKYNVSQKVFTISNPVEGESERDRTELRSNGSCSSRKMRTCVWV